MATKEYISPEEFVEIWQSADNFEEVRKKLGNSASIRACRYRKLGVELKKFKPWSLRELDRDALNAIVKSKDGSSKSKKQSKKAKEQSE